MSIYTEYYYDALNYIGILRDHFSDLLDEDHDKNDLLPIVIHLLRKYMIAMPKLAHEELTVEELNLELYGETPKTQSKWGAKAILLKNPATIARELGLLYNYFRGHDFRRIEPKLKPLNEKYPPSIIMLKVYGNALVELAEIAMEKELNDLRPTDRGKNG